MKCIGYLGPEGTFSQNALCQYMKGMGEYIQCPYPTLQDMMLAVEKGMIDEAVVPIENSLEGPVNITMDMLAFETSLKIKAELTAFITQSLLVKKGTLLQDIRCILSHPQPIGQCSKFIASALPEAEVVYVNSTAEGAKRVASEGQSWAVIGSSTLAEVYGLDILQQGIEDNKSNRTRFVVVAGEDVPPTGNDKTSIVFSVEDKPGNLYRILDIFNLWDINMTRIESRPAKSGLGKYVFFIDIHGHSNDNDVSEALTMVRRKTSFYKFLGSYPCAK